MCGQADHVHDVRTVRHGMRKLLFVQECVPCRWAKIIHVEKLPARKPDLWGCVPFLDHAALAAYRRAMELRTPVRSLGAPLLNQPARRMAA